MLPQLVMNTSIRLTSRIAAALDAVAILEDRPNRSEIIREAIREYAQRRGCWPDDGAGRPDDDDLDCDRNSKGD